MITIKEIITLTKSYGLKDGLFLSANAEYRSIKVEAGKVFLTQPDFPDVNVDLVTPEEIQDIDDNNGYYVRENWPGLN